MLKQVQHDVPLKKLLVIRFSSLGDVVLTIPVFKTLETQLPNYTIYFLTRPMYKDLFVECHNVKVITADVDHKYSGFFGLSKLANLISNHDFELIVDLHDVLRTKILRLLLKVKGHRVSIFDKGRKEKQALIKNHIQDKALPHTSERYLNAFKILKEDLKLIEGPWLHPQKTDHLASIFKSKTNQKQVGLALFSKHESKEWGQDKCQKLIDKLIDQPVTLVCFAFGHREKELAIQWKEIHPNITIVDEKMYLTTQLAIINDLDVLVSMDSANMHLASLVGTKVISIWGATHPNLGFGPLENEEGILIAKPEDAPWQPLSVYGNLNSKQSVEFAKNSMDQISVDMVYQKVLLALN